MGMGDKNKIKYTVRMETETGIKIGIKIGIKMALWIAIIHESNIQL